MADREESINIKIHLELSEEDDKKLSEISGRIEGAGSKSPKEHKEEKELKDTVEEVERFTAGNVGKVQQFSSKQFGNVRAVATNPFRFMLMAMTAGVVSKFVKGGILVGFALLIWEIIMWVLDESMKAGRALDRRFRRLAAEEIMGFITRKEQQQLRQGFLDIRVTTMQGLRGGQGQVNGNLFSHSEVYGSLAGSRTGMMIRSATTSSYTAHGFATDAEGNVRGGHRGTGQFGTH